MSTRGRVLYNSAAGDPTSTSDFRFDDSTVYRDSRLQTVNLDIDENITLQGKIGVATATPRQALEITGYSIFTGQGSSSQLPNEFGLNGSYDTLSLVSPLGIGTGGSASIFFGLNSLIYYPIARIVATDENGGFTGSLAFQTGGGGTSFVERMRIGVDGNTYINGNVFISGASFLYTVKNLPSPGQNVCLNFPSVNNASTSIVEVFVTLQKTTDSTFINMVKFTAFLGNQLSVTGITIQQNATSSLIVKPNGVKASGSKVTITYADTTTDYIATVNYMVYGPASVFLRSIDITLNDSGVTTVPGVPTGASAVAGNSSALINWTAPSTGGSVILGYTISDTSGKSLNPTGTIDGTGVFSSSLVSDAGATLLITNATAIANTEARITGLTNGTTYTFTIKAKNAIGYSGTRLVTVTPSVVPTKPLTVSAVAGNGFATITWLAPTSNGGSEIIIYDIYSNPAGFNASSRIVTPVTITGLTNGQSYTFTVIATNAAGASPSSDPSIAVTPKRASDPPTDVIATGGNRSASVIWTKPELNGGSTITSYTITSDPGGFTATSSGETPVATTVSGLSPGTSYTFTVVANNSNGSSDPSDASSPITTFSGPGQPIITNVISGLKSMTVEWTTPISNGGSTIISYYIIYNDGTTDVQTATTTGTFAVSTPQTTTVTGLLDSTAYTFKVVVTSSVASSNPSSASAAVSTFSVPPAPTITSVSRGLRSIDVSWSTPTTNGGATITSYYIIYNDGVTDTQTSPISGTFAVSTAQTTTVSGLLDSTAYTFKVVLTNSVGSSAASTTSSSISTFSIPAAPTAITATANAKSANVSWAPPTNTGGSVLTGYRIYDGSGNNLLYDGSGNIATTGTVTGLSNATSYTFTVRALNAIGASILSAVSNAVTTYDVPGPPTDVSASPGSGSATVSWTAPTSTGGSPITGYQIFDKMAGTTLLYDSSGSIATTATVTGLSNGRTYILAVQAVNVPGNSTDSNTVSITTFTTPSVPTGLTSTGGNAAATLSWTAPVTTGLAPITGYKVYDSSGNIYNSATNTFVTDTGSIFTTTTATTATLTGLANGTMYIFTIKSTNAIGNSTSSATFPGVLLGLPGSPTNLTAASGNQLAILNWTAPASNGGTAITGYRIYDSSGNLTYDGSGNIATTSTISGLTNGQTYSFSATALNSSGASPSSTPVQVTVGYPSTPGTLSAVTGNATATLTWTASSANGSTIQGYNIYDTSGNIYDTSGNFVSDTSGNIYSTNSTTYTRTISGLQNGTQYTFTVFAKNLVGLSSRGTSISVTPGLPDPPTDLIASSGNASVSFNWTAPSTGVTPTGYRINDSSNNVLYDGSGNVATTATVFGLTNGTSYTFILVSINANGTSLGSVSTSVTPFTVPSTPGNLTGTSTTNTATLNWLAPSTGGSAILGYKIYDSSGNIYDSSGNISIDTGLIYTTGPSVRTFIVPGLSQGVTYTFTLNAANSAGNSLGATISITPGAPGTPTSLTVIPGNASVQLNWLAPANGGTVTGYKISYSGINSTVSSSTLTKTITGLTNGNQYTFSVYATNATGSSLTPAIISATPGLPYAPTGLSAAAGTGSVTLNWSAPSVTGGSSITGYVVTYLTTTVPVSTTTATLTGLTAGTTYTFTVKTQNANGTSVGGASISIVSA